MEAAVGEQKLTIEEALQRISELELEVRNLTQLAHTDELTGLLNRSGFMRALSELIEEKLRERKPDSGFSFYMVDLNGLKEANDRGGGLHAGDDLLRRMAALLKEFCDEIYGFAGRIGGDEFGLVLPYLWGVPVIDELGVEFRRNVQRELKRRGRSRKYRLSFACGSVVFRPFYGSDGSMAPLDLSAREKFDLLTRESIPFAEATYERLLEFRSGLRTKVVDADGRSTAGLILAAADDRQKKDKARFKNRRR